MPGMFQVCLQVLHFTHLRGVSPLSSCQCGPPKQASFAIQLEMMVKSREIKVPESKCGFDY